MNIENILGRLWPVMIATAVALSAPISSTAKPLRIVTDIAPVQALAKKISADIQTPKQLVVGHVSAHDFALKPSDVRDLQSADLIIWMGPDVIPGFARILSGDDYADRLLTLSAVEGTRLLNVRKAGMFAAAATSNNGAIDPHSWLDPANARLWVQEITLALATLDPENADTYAQNAAELDDAIEETIKSIESGFAGTKMRPYAQFHDAFQYFEAYFGLSPLGAATADDEEETSLGILFDLKRTLEAEEESCVFFANAQQAKRGAALIESPNIHAVLIDPLGQLIANETFDYPALLVSIADGYMICFGE